MGKIEELVADIDELRQLLKTAERSKVKDILSIEIRKLETSLVALREAASSQESESAPKPSVSASVKPNPTIRIRDYAWDQTEKILKFYVTIKEVEKLSADKISLNVTKKNVTVNAVFPDKTNQFIVEGFLKDVVPEQSHHKVKSDTVVIYLKKAVDERWPVVTRAEKQIQDARDAKFRDSPKPDANEDPSAGLMNMMKKLYQEGDDEMKKTIAKAWTQGKTNAPLTDPDI